MAMFQDSHLIDTVQVWDDVKSDIWAFVFELRQKQRKQMFYSAVHSEEHNIDLPTLTCMSQLIINLNPLDARRRYTDFAQTSLRAGLRYTVQTARYRTRRQTVYLRHGV